MTSEELRSVLGRAELTHGLAFGLLALGAGLVVALGRPRARPVAVAGLLFGAAVAAALGATLELPGGLGLGLAALAVAGLAAGVRAIRPGGPVLAVLGAWLLVSRSGLTLPGWAQLLIGTAIVFGGWLLADFDARWGRRGAGPVLLTVSVAGVYLTVPDTEQALAALGAALPLALLGSPRPLASLGRAGARVAVGTLLWVVAAGNGGRGSAIVGGIACLGLLAVEPLARLLDPRRQGGLQLLPVDWRWLPVATLLHLALVAVAARVVGLRPTVAGAAAVALVVLGVAVLLALLATGARRRMSGS